MNRANRREMLTLAARALAAPGAAQFFAAWLNAADAHKHGLNPFAPPEPAWPHGSDPLFFSKPDFKMLERFTEILIPTDEQPGAREAHCARYIDFVVSSAAEYAPEMQKQWRAAMAWLNQAGFGSMSAADQESLVARISQPERDRKLKVDGFDTYALIKNNTIFAFYTSRAGLVEALEYQGNAYLKEFPGCDHPEHHSV